jgi:hypothetical protein
MSNKMISHRFDSSGQHIDAILILSLVQNTLSAIEILAVAILFGGQFFPPSEREVFPPPPSIFRRTGKMLI